MGCAGRSPFNLYRKEANGAGTGQRVTESANRQFATDWSRGARPDSEGRKKALRIA